MLYLIHLGWLLVSIKKEWETETETGRETEGENQLSNRQLFCMFIEYLEKIMIPWENK